MRRASCIRHDYTFGPVAAPCIENEVYVVFFSFFGWIECTAGGGSPQDPFISPLTIIHSLQGESQETTR